MEWRDFLIDFTDHVAPQLDTYEQAIYLYLVRHSRLLGVAEEVIAFKSARKRLAFGVGTKGTPMSEGTAYEKLQSLARKGLVELLASEHKGRRIRVRLPREVPGLIRIPEPQVDVDPESLDFFVPPENRQLILERDGGACFYCLKGLSKETFLVEHVVSRPAGNSSYRNVVASCRQCNNRKGSVSAEDFVRQIFREGLLNDAEVAKRLTAIDNLKGGNLKPDFSRAK